MGRALRANDGGVVYHALNRGNARQTVFAAAAEYEGFLRVFREAQQRVPMRVIGYCLMPNHWHMVLWPRGDGDLWRFLGWLTLTHTQRWHAAAGSAGSGHLYQGRFKSFPVQTRRPGAAARAGGKLEGADAVLSVLRYVERNPLRAALVARAQDWPYSSLAARGQADPPGPWLTLPPAGLAEDWTDLVNQPQSQKELDALRQCVVRGSPFGPESWVRQIARRLGLDSTLRPRGRPRKRQEEGSRQEQQGEGNGS